MVFGMFQTEVDFLMRLFEGVIKENLEDFKRYDGQSHLEHFAG